MCHTKPNFNQKNNRNLIAKLFRTYFFTLFSFFLKKLVFFETNVFFFTKKCVFSEKLVFFCGKPHQTNILVFGLGIAIYSTNKNSIQKRARSMFIFRINHCLPCQSDAFFLLELGDIENVFGG